MSKPIIKWVGGKRQLLKDILPLVPKSYNRYYEPFIGGGALFFELEPKNAVINDYNPELTNLYTVVKNHPKELIEDLLIHTNSEAYYFALRNLDRNKDEYNRLTNIEKASRFIFLNKTCFNGIYRVNSKGENNVPYGHRINPMIVDEENLMACSKVLSNTTILTGSFEKIEDMIQKDDFIYLDPPYAPIKADSFTTYTDKGFSLDDQIRVKELCDVITKKGAKFLLSNSSAPIILNLFHEYDISLVDASRNVAASVDGRKKVKEVLVKNYE